MPGALHAAYLAGELGLATAIATKACMHLLKLGIGRQLASCQREFFEWRSFAGVSFSI